MATAGLVEILDSLATAVRDILDDVTDVDVQVEGRLVTNPTGPCVDMYPGDASRFGESSGMGLFEDMGDGYQLTVRARVGTADNIAAQDLLLAFMDDTDPLSLAGAVTDDPTLNGLAASVDARDPTGFVRYGLGSEAEMLGFQFTAIVLPATT